MPEGLEDTAQPIGGTFNGPKQVFAEFYDTNNRFVTAVEMERVSGSKGTGKPPEAAGKEVHFSGPNNSL